MARRLLVLTTALFALSASSASAATICVPFGTGCDASSVSLQGAINIADSVYPGTRDTIRINPGYEVTENALVTGANVVDIVGGGQGLGGTVLRSPNLGFALDIQSDGSTVSGLRVRVEDRSGIGESGIGLSGEGVVADGITVLGETGVDNAVGVVVRTRAVLRNSLVQLPSTSNANNAIGAEEDTLVENVSAAADTMLDARDAGPPVVVRRLRSAAPSPTGISAFGNGSVDISDAVIRVLPGSSAGGLVAETSTGSSSIVARHVTVVGTGDPTNAGRGAYAGAFGAGGTATVDVRDSIFHALSTDLEVESVSGGLTRIPVSHTNFDAAKVDASAGDAQVNTGAANVLVNPGFVDGAGADFRLRSDSALIDRGFPGAGSTADLDGAPRPNDGNGDGVAVRDIGAFEFQRASAPPPTADTSAPLITILSKALKLDRRGRVAVVLRGPANETAVSRGSVLLRSLRRLRASAAPRRKRIALGRKIFSVMPSARTVVRVKLSRKNVRRVRARRRIRVVLAVTARDAAGNSRTARKTVSLRAVRTRR